MILACDVGGTKCSFGLFKAEGKSLRALFQRRLASRDFTSFEQAVDSFLLQAEAGEFRVSRKNIRAAGFATPGAVVAQRAHGENVPWPVDGPLLARKLGVAQVVVLNDLTASASSLNHLSPADLVTLHPAAPQHGATRTVLAAGTGLGEALLVWDGGEYRVVPSEGGQVDFAPRTEQQIALLQFLRRRTPRVSCEEILSGRGFRLLHEFLDPAVRHASFENPAADPACEITEKALARSCPICVEALDLWVAIYGAEAGNLALKALARGGVYVAGGIAPKILPKMKDGTFVRAFCDHPALGRLLELIPVYVVLNEDAPLVGAAYQALAGVRES